MTALSISEPGVYFDLDEDAYHAHPALSNSGIKHLLISPMDFWARCSWLNPDAESEETSFMELGSAYDCRIIEGSEAFYGRYAPALAPEDYPDALRTQDDLKEALTDMELKRSGSKAEMIERLIDHGYGGPIWNLLLQDHEREHEGKTLLNPDQIRRIEIAAAMIEKHPDLCKAFTGGYPQVSIIWNDEATGCPMKARLDYLKIRATVDLKTFSNPQGKPVDRAVTWSMATQKYHIQVAVYDEAVEAAKSLPVFGEHDPEWMDKLRASKDRRFLFVFQQTGIAPVARGYEVPKGLVYDCGKIVVRQAKEQYVRFMEQFGTDPWIDVADIRTMEDLEFPLFMTEGVAA